jgi:hypothetical protein
MPKTAEALENLFSECDWLKNNLQPYWAKAKDGSLTPEEFEYYTSRLANYIKCYKHYASGFVSDAYQGNPIVNYAKAGMVMVQNLENTFGFDLSSMKKILAGASTQEKKRVTQEKQPDPKAVEIPIEETSSDEEPQQPPKENKLPPNPFSFMSELIKAGREGKDNSNLVWDFISNALKS